MLSCNIAAIARRPRSCVRCRSWLTISRAKAGMARRVPVLALRNEPVVCLTTQASQASDSNCSDSAVPWPGDTTVMHCEVLTARGSCKLYHCASRCPRRKAEAKGKVAAMARSHPRWEPRADSHQQPPMLGQRQSSEGRRQDGGELVPASRHTIPVQRPPAARGSAQLKASPCCT